MNEHNSSAVRFFKNAVYTGALAAASVLGYKALNKAPEPQTIDTSLAEVQKDAVAAHKNLETYKLDTVNQTPLTNALNEIKDAVQANRFIQTHAKPSNTTDMEAVAYASNNIAAVVSQLPGGGVPGAELNEIRQDAKSAVAKNDSINNHGTKASVTKVFRAGM